MYHRILNPLKNSSFFLFGARGTGKSTLLSQLFTPEQAWFIDLLDPVQDDLFNRRPQELEQRVLELPPDKKWVVIDEIQKAPHLLNLVHRLIEKNGCLFALTGSSSRKLKRGAANLLAGRAFVYHLFPLTHRELQTAFQLEAALAWGTLPNIFHFTSDEEKTLFLRAYSLTYLKEEIVAEQLIRNLNPFRNFLEVAAQCNGQIINFSKIARDIGVDSKTVQAYFSILEETLVGFMLPAYHHSVRKRQRSNPKFYFFDLGVKRALERTLDQKIYPRTYEYGLAFEHWVILEIHRLAHYFNKDWTFSYLLTKDNAEIDLILDRPGLPTALIEIKSTDQVSAPDVGTLNRLAPDIANSQAYCLSQDPARKRIGQTLCLPWQAGIQEIIEPGTA
jgi:predicted AAA+ superfamily ATPase